MYFMENKSIWSIVGILLIGILSYFGYSYYSNNGTKYEYYDNGTVELKYHLNNGKLHGEYISYYPDGKIKVIENYKNGDMYGEHISYFKNGNLRNHYFIKDGNYDFSKEFIDYYSNGQKKTYRDSNYEYTEYFLNGQIETTGMLNESGGRMGKRNQYDETGKRIATLVYENGSPYNGNIYRYWYHYSDESEEETRYVWKIENYRDGNLDGLQYEYYENGDIKAVENYKDGNLDGLQYEYYENGDIKAVENYKDGKLDGKE